MSSLRTKILFSFVLLLPFLVLGPQRSSAAPYSEWQRRESHFASSGLQEAQTCNNLDVVFIIDQSDSMSTPPANDPTNQRTAAVKGMIDLLVDNAVDQCQGAYHRVGVISFGDAIEIDLPMSDIHPANVEDANELRERLKLRISARNMGQTHTKEAFELAAQMLNDLSPVPGDETRKRVVVLLTDGYPCYGENCNDRYLQEVDSLIDYVNKTFYISDNMRNREKCLQDLREQYSGDLPPDKKTACLEKYPVSTLEYSKSTYIYGILLRNSGGIESKNIDEKLTELFRFHGGDLIRLKKNREDIPTTMREILSRLIGVRPNLLNCGAFAVNPYLRKIIVTAYKASPEIKITMSYRDAENVEYQIQDGKAEKGGFTLDANGYYVFDANERYAILNPYPGIWNLESSNCEGIDVYYDEIDFAVKQYQPITELPVYDRPPYYNPTAPFYLEYRLQDLGNNGAIVAPVNKQIFAIEMKAEVVRPDGVKDTYTLEWDAQKQVFVSTTPLLVPVAGNYKLYIHATSHRHDGSPLLKGNLSEADVFSQTYSLFDVQSDFNVINVVPVTLQAIMPKEREILKPIHDTVLNQFRVKPVSVQVLLTDEQKNPLSASDVFTQPENTVRAYILQESTGKKSDTVYLKPDSQDTSRLVGEIPNVDFEGEQTLIVEIQKDNLIRGYWAYNPTMQVPFTRKDGLFSRVSTYYALLVMATLVFLGMVAYNISIRTNKISGTLVFVDGTTRIAEFGLSSGKNFRVITSRELEAYPQLGLKWIRAQNASKEKRPKKPSDDLSWDTDIQHQKAIRLECKKLNGQKFSIEDLAPHVPTTYSEETMAQMVYEPLE